MSPEAAKNAAVKLNERGRFADTHYYYPTWHAIKDEWFVMRRPKSATVTVAMYVTGELACGETW